jgi:hypothetical protein
MDENVVAAALRLNEPITFDRVEPLHDTGRHRTLSPFWKFAAHHTESKMLPATQGRMVFCRRTRATRKGFNMAGSDDDLLRCEVTLLVLAV